MRSHVVAKFIVVLLVAGIAGCGNSGTDTTAKVIATVTLDGASIEGVNVTFMPETGRPASALTDAEGKATLSTFEAFDGAIPGNHKVAIAEQPSDSEPMPGTPEAANWTAPESRFSEDYADPAKSGFTAVVEPGKTNEFTFEMISK